MKNLNPERFLLQKQNQSDKALITSSVTYSFDELKKKVFSTAYHLKEQNISDGDRVGIIGKNDSDFVINILALWQLSTVPVPLNTRLTVEEINEQLTSANCSATLAHDEFYERIKNIGNTIIEYPLSVAGLALLYFLLKSVLFILFFYWLRGTLPRLRYVQLMAFGWKVLLPASLLNLLWVAGVVALRARL